MTQTTDAALVERLAIASTPAMFATLLICSKVAPCVVPILFVAYFATSIANFLRTPTP